MKRNLHKKKDKNGAVMKVTAFYGCLGYAFLNRSRKIPAQRKKKMKRLCQKLKKLITKFNRDESGSVTVYVAGFAVLGLGLGALSIDTGRSTVLRTQMQNRADAGAMAGAAQLDGRENARARATSMAQNSIIQTSRLTSDGSDLTVESVVFYQELEPVPILADSDESAKFIEVNMTPKTMNYIFQPFSTSNSLSTSTTLQAEAVAQPDPYMCHAPPLMICDLGENDPSIDMQSNDIVGRQVVLKPPLGGDAWAPGNYGLLALPDGSIGASFLESALAAVEPQDCYGLEVGTAPGVKTDKVQSGINARFDYETTWPYPAPNVINYPQDSDILSGLEGSFGNGSWDRSAYWLDKHGTPLPDDLMDATRYQVYLYELGESFGRNGTLTHYPIDDALPTGYEEITPPSINIATDASHSDDPDYDGNPSQAVASNGVNRRLLKVAILQCIADDVRGSHNYPTSGKYLEMFVTQAVPGTPAGGIYGEIVRPLTPTITPDFHANVKLIR